MGSIYQYIYHRYSIYNNDYMYDFILRVQFEDGLV